MCVAVLNRDAAEAASVASAKSESILEAAGSLGSGLQPQPRLLVGWLVKVSVVRTQLLALSNQLTALAQLWRPLK
jgi:hypothetical protein